jgi:hypothetical protein
LVGHSQLDLFGADFADVMDESFKDKLIKFARNPHELSGKSSSGYLVELKAGKTPNRKSRMTISSLEQMKDILLLVFKMY